MKLLFTGFEPLTQGSPGMSWKWIEGLEEMTFEGHELATLRLPARWDECFEPLQQRLRDGWDAVVCLGEKTGDAIAIERLALNENDPSRKDAQGRRPREKAIDPSGEPGYWTGLAYRELGLRLSAASLPAAPSHSAGGGLPNHVFYKLMRWLAASGSKAKGGLIQVPASEGAIAVNAALRSAFASCVLDTLGSVTAADERLAFDPARLGRLSQRL